MAKATKTVKQEEVVWKTTKEVTGVTLELSEVEAKVLVGILERVGGSPSGSPRKFADAIGNALDAAGVETPFDDTDDYLEEGKISIYFKDGFPPGFEEPAAVAPPEPLKPYVGARIKMLEDYPEHGRGIKKGTEGVIVEKSYLSWVVRFPSGEVALFPHRFEVLPS